MFKKCFVKEKIVKSIPTEKIFLHLKFLIIRVYDEKSNLLTPPPTEESSLAININEIREIKLSLLKILESNIKKVIDAFLVAYTIKIHHL